ncbi:uncharacterized protein [Apostichopus japonicus]|uniref:uncharacterized protein n=1 Tax=Stichopus japonicus TaxID=307972 RepID=UPI003AB5F8A0
MAARFVRAFNLMNCLKGGMEYTLLQAQETNRYQGFLLPLIIPNAYRVSVAIVIASIFHMWHTSVSSFMNKAFQLASNHFYSTLGIITPVFIVFYRAFMCLPSSRRANLIALACLIVLIATLNPAEGAALPTTCAAACLTSPDHYCKEVFRSECRKCSVTCSNPNNWNECEENCKGSQFYPVEATTAGEPFVAARSVTPDASTTSSPVVSNTFGGSTGFERGSEYYPVDATTGEVSTAAPSVAPTVATSLWQVPLWIILGVAVVIIVVVIIIWKKKGGCTGSPGVTVDTRVTVIYAAVDSNATFVGENNSTGPVPPLAESNQAEAVASKVTTTFVREKNSTVPVQPSEESNQAEGGCTGSPGVKGDTHKDGVTVSYKAVDSKVTTTFVREKNSTVPVQPSEESNQAEAKLRKYQTAHKENSTRPVQPSEESDQADGKAISNCAKGRGTAKPDGRNGPRTAEAICSGRMAVSGDPMNTEMHPVDQESSGE